MRIFPFILSRIGGDSFEAFTFEDTQAVELLFNKIRDLQKEMEESRLGAVDSLFGHLKDLADSANQNLLQNIRRDIYNCRKVKDNALNKAVGILPPEIVDAVMTYENLRIQAFNLNTQLDKLYYETENDIRLKLIDLANKTPLTNGLIFSSRTLFERISKYTIAGKVTSKALQTERAILKYLSRIHTKTSPFSSFTNISQAKIEDVTDSNVIRCQCSGTTILSHLRINSAVFFLLAQKFNRDRDFYRHFAIKLNPTMKKGGRRFKFLVNKNNVEIFQYVERNQILDLIVSMLRRSQTIQTFQEFASELNQIIESTLDELHTYLYKLVESGFIETYLGISGLDPNWDRKLVQALVESKIEDVRIFPLTNAIVNFSDLREKYSTLDSNSRFRLLREIFTRIEAFILDDRNAVALGSGDVSNDVEKRTNKSLGTGLKEEMAFFEDTTSNAEFLIERRSLDVLITKLDSLLKSISFLDVYTYEIERMKIYFNNKYKNADQISVLRFYEDYYKDFKLEEDRRSSISNFERSQEKLNFEPNAKYEKYLRIIESDTGRIERIKNIEIWKGAIRRKLDKMTWSDTLSIDDSFIAETLNGLDVAADSTKRGCFGAFVQFIGDKDKLIGVVNSTGPGYGRMFGRFLHLFPPEIPEMVQDWNDCDSQEVILAECVDGSFFNANIHPPLLRYEISMPGSNNSLPVEKQVPVNKLAVKYLKNTEELILWDNTSKKRIFVLDLGFQGEMGRSKLFQLLTKFTCAPMVGSHNLASIFHEAIRTSRANSLDEIRILPRIVYAGQIVLARKRWEIPTSKLLAKLKGEDNRDYFKRLNNWRMAIGLPTEVFLSINPYRRNGRISPGKIGNDDYKPQYINFLWPQFARLFARLVEKDPDIMWIEEMLPDSQHLLRIDGQRYVSEFAINWYN